MARRGRSGSVWAVLTRSGEMLYPPVAVLSLSLSPIIH